MSLNHDQSLALVNDLAGKHYDAPDFSNKIRGRRQIIKLLAERRGTGADNATLTATEKRCGGRIKGCQTIWALQF